MTELSVRIALDAAVAFGTIALAVFTAVLAFQGRRANTHAEDLYRLQSEDMARRERAERPNLQLFDVRQDERAAEVAHLALVIEVMNFGRRPARIEQAELQVDYGGGEVQRLDIAAYDSGFSAHS